MLKCDIRTTFKINKFELRIYAMNFKETSKKWAAEALPKRLNDSNKGTYGRLFMYVGSETFPGAALLALEAALRGGVGYVECAATGELKRDLLQKFPETIFKDFPSSEHLTDGDILRMREDQRRATATLIGCGSGKSPRLASLILSLLSEDGGTLILDADAINSLEEVKEGAKEALKNSVRQVIITPHPLEFSRISGYGIEYINNNREESALKFAKETGCTVLLKGYRTVITDGNTVFVNTSGSSALSKAGSGDALAGFLASLAATKIIPAVTLSALAAFVHGMAGDNLSSQYSEYGVTPSDLPREMAKALRELEKHQK